MDAIVTKLKLSYPRTETLGALARFRRRQIRFVMQEVNALEEAKKIEQVGRIRRGPAIRYRWRG